eukprot:TRINITY_DN52282_c0_g1_i2.p1 TRINITY_DN52282_c0_g1~~TRINITY_DN52282_c0_g1_i2.p1  ORF type:complete len:109 (+),score=21.15 TRINITY_DN52282_c0_g1_i2:38-328(+)
MPEKKGKHTTTQKQQAAATMSGLAAEQEQDRRTAEEIRAKIRRLATSQHCTLNSWRQIQEQQRKAEMEALYGSFGSRQADEIQPKADQFKLAFIEA